MKKYIILLGLLSTFLLGACNSDGASEAAAQSEGENRLVENYTDALSVQEQLIIGTFNLEETELAVDEAQAQILLPLWRALESLENSATTAEAELTAVINQIQDNMTAEQIAAIAEMALTADDVQTAVQNAGVGAIFRGGGNGRGEETADGGFAPPAGGLGGRPGGGIGGQGGGGIEGAGGAPDQDAIATRQAAAAEGDFAGSALITPLISLLEIRAGEREAPEPGADGFARGGFFGQAVEIVANETGLTVEAIQTQTAEGSTLAEIIEENGGDVEAIREALENAMAETPLPEGTTLDEVIDNILG